MTHTFYDLFGIGYPDSQSTTYKFDQDLSDRLYKKYFGNRKGIKVNTMWDFSSAHPFDRLADAGLTSKPKTQQVIDLLGLYPDIECIMFFEFFDRMSSNAWRKTLEFCIERLGIENVKIIGNVENNEFRNEWFPYWFLACNTFFYEYTEEDIRPSSFEHTYICYNRKPSKHRRKLQQSFIKEDLFKHGIFTMGNVVSQNEKHEIEVTGLNIVHKTYPDNCYGHNANMSQEDEEYNIPADAFSLGNLSVWKKSFLCIVTETLSDESNAVYPLLTEKTYKPIIGMRPFIIVGESCIPAKLRELGFYTFEAEIPSDPVEAVKFLQNENLDLLYKKLYPRLVNNKRVMNRFTSDKKRFYNCLDL